MAQPALNPPSEALIAPLVAAALREDLGDAGDITAALTIPAETRGRARIVAREAGRLCGLACARLAFQTVDPATAFRAARADGDAVAPGALIAEIEGLARALLSAERVALNFIGQLSGVATATDALVRAVAGTRARIACTRKTTPGLRLLEKYAVRCGGGINHRFGLYDAVLIKDNHIAAAGGVAPALTAAKRGAGHLVRIEIEVDTLAQLEEALAAGADAVLLDNMTPDQLGQAVALNAGRAVLEASGNVRAETVRAIAETGVDVISSGAITHSPRVLDIGLDWG